jgi:2-(1,2-epoxy-1,2-dihydrophenyl)acetyl-CoA isomerase
MHHDLWAALDQAEANPAIRALVITGAGRGFCAGADLSEFDCAPGRTRCNAPTPARSSSRPSTPRCAACSACACPRGAVNGVAAGAGASLAMTCDIAIAAPGASFIQAFSKIGLMPDAGGTWFLPQRLGLARAMGWP